jgi:hypothetical protein
MRNLDRISEIKQMTNAGIYHGISKVKLKNMINRNDQHLIIKRMNLSDLI